MTSDLEERAYEIFCAAIEQPLVDQLTFVEARCQSDPALLRLVMSLLDSSKEAESFLSAPTMSFPNRRHDEKRVRQHEPQSGNFIAQYELVERVGVGGFGEVWSAMQHHPVSRKVAIKIIKLGMDSRQIIARFEAERQALAMMDHPNIARVFDAGTTEAERPFFVMEYIDGLPITEFCSLRQLGLVSRLELFMGACRAVQHAHQKGVIHRDIKPSNVMVTSHDEIAMPKVIDFGVAKATDATVSAMSPMTVHQQLVGTPAYMSPEQASGGSREIDTRSDIYSLGVLLYELLAGSTPFESATLQMSNTDFIHVIQFVEPERPSLHLERYRSSDPNGTGSLVSPASVKGDLDWIALKCLQKDPSRRYESAGALCDDIQRHLDLKPVSAGPPSALYKAQKFASRNKGAVIAASLVGLAVTLGASGTVVGISRSLSEAKRAERELGRATEIKGLIADMLRSVDPQLARTADTTLMRGILESADARLHSGAIADELVVAELRHLIGSVYFQLQIYDRAMTQLEQAMEIRSRIIGSESPEAMESLQLLANVHARLFDWDRALPLLQQAVGHNESRYGPESIEALRAKLFLGQALVTMGRHEEGRAMLSQMLAFSRETMTVDPQVLLSTQRALAEALTWLKEFNAAEQLYRTTLEAHREQLGSDHPDTLQTMNLFGLALRANGKPEEAEMMHREAAETQASVFGPDTAPTAWAERLLGESIAAQGRFPEAEALLLHSVEKFRAVGTPSANGHVSQISLYLASRYESDLRYADAELMYRQHAETTPPVWGLGSKEAQESSDRLAAFLRAQGRDSESLEVQRAFVEEILKAASDLNASRELLYRAAEVLLLNQIDKLQEPELAIEFAQRAYDAIDPARPEEQWKYCSVLALANFNLGNFTEAVRLRDLALESKPASVTLTPVLLQLDAGLESITVP